LEISKYNLWEYHFSVTAGKRYASCVSPKVSTAANGKTIHFLNMYFRIFGFCGLLLLIDGQNKAIRAIHPKNYRGKFSA
jgi:hypothetical protein